MDTSLDTSFANGQLTVTEPSTGDVVGRIKWLDKPSVCKRYAATFGHHEPGEKNKRFYSVTAAEYWILMEYLDELEGIKVGGIELESA